MSNQYHTIVQGIRWISNRIDGFFYVSAIIITRDQQSYPGRRYPRRDVTLVTSFENIGRLRGKSIAKEWIGC